MKIIGWNYILGLAEERMSGGFSPWQWPSASRERVRKAQEADRPPANGEGAKDWELALSAKARSILFKQALPAPSPEAEPQQFLSLSRCLAGYLPDSVLMALTLFHGDSRAPGAIVVRGLPLGHGASAPGGSTSCRQRSNYVDEALLGAFAAILGAPRICEDAEGGSLIETWTLPHGEILEEGSSCPASRRLCILDAHRERPADYVLYLVTGGEGRQGVCSRLANVADALRVLPEEIGRLLALPLFRIGASSAMGSAVKRRVWSRPVPLVFDHGGFKATRLAGDNVMALSPEAEIALAAYRAALIAVSKNVSLQPGDALLIDNRKAVHEGLSLVNESRGASENRVLRMRVSTNG